MSKTQDSKLLSLVLRHQPEELGIELDPAGWTSVDALIEALRRRDPAWSLERLQAIVAESEKKRFAFDASGTRIRASQGHSVEVDLGYEAQVPPALLYHGAVARFLDTIRARGLLKGDRHHVHLSSDVATARLVGARRGEPVILTIRAAELNSAGHAFFLSANGVWLTEHVPAGSIIFPQASG
jgi:RNA:NAD 2''-phosphotransferase